MIVAIIKTMTDLNIPKSAETDIAKTSNFTDHKNPATTRNTVITKINNIGCLYAGKVSINLFPNSKILKQIEIKIVGIEAHPKFEAKEVYFPLPRNNLLKINTHKTNNAKRKKLIIGDITNVSIISALFDFPRRTLAI